MIIWKSVAGYEGLYEVSNTGLIRSVERVYFSGANHSKRMIVPEKLMALKTDKDGYYYVGLRKNKVRAFKRVSRLVCETFHENPQNKPTVNHKDGNKQNNHETNLEWTTYSENEFHSYKVLGKKSKGTLGRTGKLVYNAKPLYQYDLAGNLIKAWESLHLAVSAGYTMKSLYQVMNGDFKQHKGFFWSRQKLSA